MPSGHIFSRQWMNRHEKNATSRRNLRPDIQGLRMLAVVAVILDHLVRWPTGGFVGVDVFFVISGFLITGILLREHEKTGHISFINFYKRRIKRIIPAATVVLVATAAVGFWAFNQARAWQTFWDAIWSFFFAANWHFAAAGTDYFQAGGPVSPLQHFWSLSVEEQFYFVWPWLMLGVLALAGLRKEAVRRRTVTGVLMLIIVVATFAWAMYESTANPTVAYFSTFTRAWELGLGALVAIASPWWAKIPHAIRPVLGWAGFLGILASYFVINDSMPFPAPWALLPVLATALVIVGGTGGEQRFLYPLTNPVSFYLGNISYSLYLWHFPVIIFAGTLLPETNWVYYAVASGATLVLAAASFHLVEIPVQTSPWLVSFRDRRSSSRSRSRTWKETRSRAWREWWITVEPVFKWGGTALVALVTAAVVTVALLPQKAPSTDTIAFPDPANTASSVRYGPEVDALQQDIAEALQARSWPSLSPSLDEVIATDSVVPGSDACAGLIPPSVDHCIWGDPSSPKRAVLVGDSIAMAWLPALLPIFSTGEWHLGRVSYIHVRQALRTAPAR